MEKDGKKTIRFETIARAATVGISVIALVWGGISFLITQRLEARRPFLDYQLEMYKETATVAAKLATSNNPEELDKLRKRFCELYWGELALVETPTVEAAMVKFKEVLSAGVSQTSVSVKGVSEETIGGDVCDEGLLREGSNSRRLEALNLAHDLRSSLAKSWGVDDWEYVPP